MSSETNAGAGGDATVAIVGAGIIGLAIGWHLVKRGLRVTLYDPAPPGSGCSSGNAGAISPGSVVPLAGPGVLGSAPAMLLDPASALHIPARYWLRAAPWLMRFAAASRPARIEAIAAALSGLYGPALDCHQALAREIGAPDLVRATGQLHLYRDAAQHRDSRRDWAIRAAHGVRFEVLDRAGIEALEPQIGPAYRIGVFVPDAGMSINPHRHATAIATALTRAGAEFVPEAALRFAIEGRRVSGVLTASSTRAHSAVVVAAGAWSARLLRQIGYRVPLETQRGYHVDFPASGVTLGRPVVPADRKVFITAMEDGLRVAGTVELAGLDAPPTEARARLLHRDLLEAIPDARTDDAQPFWMGHRPCLPDSMPVLGPAAAWGGLYLAFGHGHLGLTASARTGDILARMIAGAPVAEDMAPFALERFRGGA